APTHCYYSLPFSPTLHSLYLPGTVSSTREPLSLRHIADPYFIRWQCLSQPSSSSSSLPWIDSLTALVSVPIGRDRVPLKRGSVELLRTSCVSWPSILRRWRPEKQGGSRQADRSTPSSASATAAG